MKFIKISLSLIILFTSFQFCLGQVEPKSILFGELSDQICSEILAYNLDYFLVELHKNPDAKGYVVFNGKTAQEGKNLLYLEESLKYIRVRGFDINRIVAVRGENKDKMTMQFWIVPDGAKTPTVEKNLIKEKIDSTTRFDVAWADWHKWNNSEWTIYSHSFVEWGCEMDLNMKAFAEALRSQSNLTGYLVVYPKFGKGKNQAKKVTDFAVKELTQQYKLSKEKLRIIYGGNRNKPQLELWLVPKGNNPPIPNPDKIIKNGIS